MTKGKKITVWTLKGGEGKTTIACAIALEGDWAIITNDIHSDLTSALKEEHYLVLDPDQPLPTKKELEGANIIFDPGGFLDHRMIDAVKMSDYVIIPVSEFGKKLNTERFIASVLEIEQYNKNIVIVLNKIAQENVEEARKALKQLMSKEFKATYPIFEIKKNEAFEMMLNTGASISEIVKRGGLFRRWFQPVDGQLQKLIKFINGGK
ncbi:MAG: ParA family protein [Proteobacteria bacterium]|nr:ParA family protein [Pseudomonadota bacterium]